MKGVRGGVGGGRFCVFVGRERKGWFWAALRKGRRWVKLRNGSGIFRDWGMVKKFMVTWQGRVWWIS